MSKNIRESQQQGEGITIGTQGNENMPTPLGDDLNDQKERGGDDRHIPNQEKSSAANLRRGEEQGDQNGEL